MPDDLDIRTSVHLAALFLAQEQRLPVTPTRRMTAGLMKQLHAAGVIEVPTAEDLRNSGQYNETAPIEMTRWRYVWPRYPRDKVALALSAYLESACTAGRSRSHQLELWIDLAAAEAESYYEHRLTKHQFEADWSQDMTYAIEELPYSLSIAQWRYCAWAATRQGASIALQRSMTPDGVRNGMYRELQLRALRIGAGEWKGCEFIPRNSVPPSALARLFTAKLSSLGVAYWSTPPSEKALSPTCSPMDRA